MKTERALELGLVNRIFPYSDLLDQVIAKASQLVAQPPASVRLTKALLKENHTQQVAEVMSKEGKLFLDQLEKPEAQAAINAFIQKAKNRKP